MSSFTIRPYRPGDEDGINQGFNEVFGTGRTLAAWRTKFEPVGQRSAILVGVDGEGTIQSHFAVLVERMRIGGAVVRAGQGVDHFARRLRPVIAARLHQRTADAFFAGAAEGPPLALLYGFPGDRALRLGRLTLDYLPPVPVPWWVRDAAGAAGDPAGFRAEELVLGQGGLFRLDRLWESARDRHPAAAVRDLGWWVGRFLERTGAGYRLVVAHRDGEPAAAGVFLGVEGRMAWLDLLWDGRAPGALAALDGFARTLASEVGLARLALWLRGDPEAAAVLAGLGWVPGPHPQGLHLTTRAAPGAGPEAAEEFVARGTFTWADSDLA